MTTLDELIAEASASGGSERANYQLFIAHLCAVLDVPAPGMSGFVLPIQRMIAL